MDKYVPLKIKNDRLADDDTIRVSMIPDYGDPKLDDEFFEENQLWESSARMLLYICMTHPDFEKAARDCSLMFISREYSNEEDKIERSGTPDELFEILKSDPDVVNHPILIEKILENPAPLIPMIIDEIKYTHSDFFIETSLKILYRSKIDCSNELIDLIRAPVKCAYALSAVAMLLGMIGSKNAIKPVWDCYNYLKEYHHERHEQGPLIGLYELKKRGIISRISNQISGH